MDYIKKFFIYQNLAKKSISYQNLPNRFLVQEFTAINNWPDAAKFCHFGYFLGWSQIFVFGKK